MWWSRSIKAHKMEILKYNFEELILYLSIVLCTELFQHSSDQIYSHRTMALSAK